MGVIFKIPAVLLYAVAGLWGGFVILGLISDYFGLIGIIISLMVAPITFAVVPWYEGFSNSHWFPVILVYGSVIYAMVLYGIGSAIDGYD